MPFLHTQKSCCTIVQECVLRLSKKKAEINAHKNLLKVFQERRFVKWFRFNSAVVDNINGLVETLKSQKGPREFHF